MTHAQYRGGSVSGAYVDPYPGRRGDERISRSCSKCSGTGRLHTQVDGGRCWSCGGSGQTSVLVSSARATERRRIRRDAERQAQREAHSEELDQAWVRAVRLSVVSAGRDAQRAPNRTNRPQYQCDRRRTSHFSRPAARRRKTAQGSVLGTLFPTRLSHDPVSCRRRRRVWSEFEMRARLSANTL